MNIKELNINGIVYAKYHIQDEVIFINVLVNIVDRSEFDSENVIISIISLVEKTKFQSVSYLNV